jgi:hypothetical protein
MREGCCFFHIVRSDSTDSKGLRQELLGSSVHLLHAICIINFASLCISVQPKESSSIIKSFDEFHFEKSKYLLIITTKNEPSLGYEVPTTPATRVAALLPDRSASLAARARSTPQSLAKKERHHTRIRYNRSGNCRVGQHP